ncbi:hypothetical protein [Nonomuraea rubra]|uniref:hypothetical protein n=1 Tax=Nonomuraea rubra TaxID=46180 RepID=UPI0033D94A16
MTSPRRISCHTCGPCPAGGCWASDRGASFLVRQAGGDTYECVTGVMPGDPPGIYKSHGHLVRVIVVTG